MLWTVASACVSSGQATLQDAGAFGPKVVSNWASPMIDGELDVLLAR